jgi:hypothetical protein
MAYPNFKNGPKTRLCPSGVNGTIVKPLMKAIMKKEPQLLDSTFKLDFKVFIEWTRSFSKKALNYSIAH